MTITISGHRVVFYASGRIEVDGKIIPLAVKMTNGGHFTYLASGPFDEPDSRLAALADRKLTGPKRPVGSYEHALAADIVSALF